MRTVEYQGKVVPADYVRTYIFDRIFALLDLRLDSAPLLPSEKMELLVEIAEEALVRLRPFIEASSKDD